MIQIIFNSRKVNLIWADKCFCRGADTWHWKLLDFKNIELSKSSNIVLKDNVTSETIGMHRVTKFEVLIMDIHDTFSTLCHRKAKKQPSRKLLRKSKGKKTVRRFHVVRRELLMS